MPDDPKGEYTSRLKDRRAFVGRLEQQHIRLGNVNLAIAAAALLIFWLAFGRHRFTGWWLLAPAGAFVALSIVHGRVLAALRLAQRAVAFYEGGLARLEDRWAGTGEGGDRFDDPAHPYAEDLDLFGRGSLFELLSTARLRAGEETLARWLLAPAAPEQVLARQQAIAELKPRLDLREQIALIGEDLRSAINPAALVKWAERPPILNSRAARVIALVLALAAVAGAAIWALWGVPEVFFAVAMAEALFHFHWRRRIFEVVELVGEPAYGLALFAGILERLEREPFTNPHLAALRQSFEVEQTPAWKQVARLNRWMELLHSRDNVAVRIIGPPLLWTTQVAFAIEAWRMRSGPAVRRWIDAVGQLEALLSLANYAFEHPADPFPELAPDGACFDAERLAHPLLPEARAVRNDLRLCDRVRVLVVSGSNMSGKSTLLRTVGVNAVLAMAGAPVHARRLRLSPLTLGASIRTLDSLRGGSSRFYTEITRLRLLVDLAKEPPPLLFLLDELLHGTNSHDRRIGAEAVVRGLVERGAIGLLTTHDLALAHIADVLAPRGDNVHFEDQLEDGKIQFDYRLRPGVVRKSNALELMRSIGLEV